MPFTLVRRQLVSALATVPLAFVAAHAQQTVYGPGMHYASTQADAEFMQGMIMHHAQAIVMTNEAKSHGASSAVALLCSRINLSQGTEIKFMRNWLRDRHYTVPDSTGKMPDNMSGMAGMSDMGGMAMGGSSDPDNTAPMAGMLTPHQMRLLDSARGPVWDRLFLTFMIQHHQGALSMVNKLTATPGAGQDEDMFRFITGVNADQTGEIDRMKAMLAGVSVTSSGGR